MCLIDIEIYTYLLRTANFVLREVSKDQFHDIETNYDYKTIYLI